jgi:hypothetical protein
MENAVVSKDRKKTKNNKKPYRRFWGLITTAIVILAILLAGVVWLERQKASQNEKYNRIYDLYLSLNQKAENIDKTKNFRIKFFKNKFLTNMGKSYANCVSNFIGQLGLWANKEFNINTLEVIPLDQNFSFTIKGFINTSLKRYASVQFQKFYQQLKNYETMVTINLNRVDAKNPTGNPGGILFFAINGEVETE